MNFISILMILASISAQADSTLIVDRSCLDCHISGTWYPLSEKPGFDHNRDTDFELRYSHGDLTCTQCHSGQNIQEFHRFQTKGASCYSCHQDAHQNYWGPNCEDCHTPDNWKPEQSYRRHEQTLMPLIGGHFGVDCYFCHTHPNQTPSLDCQVCHAADFLPNIAAHAGLSSSSDCSTCHAPTRWDQILALNHDGFFPIYSGEHRSAWSSCSNCHTSAGDYQTFTCFGSGCHSISRMNSEHCDGNDCERCSGLTYPSSGVSPDDCYFCHPQGNNSKCGD